MPFPDSPAICKGRKDCRESYFVAGRLLYCYKIRFSSMKNESGSQSEESVISPGAFIAGLEPMSSFRERAEQHRFESISKPCSENMSRISLNDGTKSSERSQKKRLAGLKSRVKKQKQLQKLEEKVNQLSRQIQQCQRQISKCKDELVQAIKLSTHNSGEHAFTFSELEKLITAEDADLDQINLLLDIIQSRIGANGKQRQSKLEYNFKQIINSLFPAMHRYLMYSAVKNKDLFFENKEQKYTDEHPIQKWTRPMYDEVKLTPKIFQKIIESKPSFTKKRLEAIQLISKLKKVKDQLKSQEQTIQRAVTCIRQEMTPIQSSQLILFGQKNKLRREFLFLDQIFVMSPAPSKQQKVQ